MTGKTSRKIQIGNYNSADISRKNTSWEALFGKIKLKEEHSGDINRKKEDTTENVIREIKIEKYHSENTNRNSSNRKHTSRNTSRKVQVGKVHNGRYHSPK